MEGRGEREMGGGMRGREINGEDMEAIKNRSLHGRSGHLREEWSYKGGVAI